MNKLKKISACIAALTLSLSCYTYNSFAVAENYEKKSIEAEITKALAENLELYARYNADKENLYEGAIEAMLKKNPELLDTALSGMVSSIDEHSVYYTAEESNVLFDSLTDEIVGIGVNVLARDGKILVSQPIPGTPAEKAGIKAGDIIVEANGISLENMDLDTAVDYIRGEQGTEVNVKVWRSSVNSYITFNIIREKVVSNPVDYEIIEEEGKEKIAKIQIYSFTDNAEVHFEEALKKADKDEIKNLIIDLRYNGGGYLDSAVKIADMFLPEGSIITSEDHKVPVFNKIYSAKGKDTNYNIVVLINEMSASASEVLTAALRENGKAKVLGVNSFGKGTVQTIGRITNGAVVKYTTAYYLTPEGNNINEVGIQPDLTIENSLKDVDALQFGEFNYQQSYKLGDKNPQIEIAKKMLEFIGLYIGEINDVYDENLKLAVYTYQDMKDGLYAYGELDKTTQLSIYTTLCEMKEEVDDQLEAAIQYFNKED